MGSGRGPGPCPAGRPDPRRAAGRPARRGRRRAPRPRVKIEDGQGRLTVGALTVEVNAEGLVRFLRTDDGRRAARRGARPLLVARLAPLHRRRQRPPPPGAALRRLRRREAVRPRASTSTGGSTRRAWSSTWSSATPRSASRCSPPAAATPCCGTTRRSAASSWRGNGTRWVADSARQIDYWITAGDPADAQRRYSAATGRTPMLPEWAAGFWQCKLRYRTQDELLAVAREYKRRGPAHRRHRLRLLPLDAPGRVEVRPDRVARPGGDGPGAGRAGHQAGGVRLAVGVAAVSENHHAHGAARLLHRHPVRPDGARRLAGQGGRRPRSRSPSTTPPTRRPASSCGRGCSENYLDPYGITAFWLDACEPELKPGFPENLRYWAGPGLEVGNIYPAENARTFYEGLRAAGEERDRHPQPLGVGGQSALRRRPVVR